MANRDRWHESGMGRDDGRKIIFKMLAFDFGHTLVDEQKDSATPIESRSIHLMPGVLEVLPHIPVALAVWANTRTATEADLRNFLARAGIATFFTWVVTSVEAGFRKPAPEFFDFALAKCGCAREEVLFVGNQLNTDIWGARNYGISTVWLSGSAYRSLDDTMTLHEVQPTYIIETLGQLPTLLQSLDNNGSVLSPRVKTIS